MNKDVNIYSFNDECYVYLGDYRKLQQENQQLHDKLDKAVEYIEDCCNMNSQWTHLHFNYAQNDMPADNVDELLEILKGDVNE